MNHQDPPAMDVFRTRTILLVLFVLVAAVYGNALSGQFIWDDEFLVRGNAYIRDLRAVPSIFTSTIGAGAGVTYDSYRPVQLLSYLLDYQLWGLNPAGYHLTNIFIHLLAGWGVFFLARLLAASRAVALVAAAFFLVHPVQVEAVTYISARADCLSGLLAIAGLCLYIKSTRAAGRREYWLSVGCFLLALLTREGSLILPVVFWWYHRAFHQPARLKRFVPFVLIAFLYAVFRCSLGLTPPPPATSAWARLPGAFAALAGYLRILVWPFHLHMEYGKTLFPVTDPRVAAGAVMLAGLIWTGAWARRRDPLVTFSVGFFLITLAPTLNIIPVNAFMAEHWLYFPSVGIFILLAHWLARLGAVPRFRRAVGGLVIGWIVFLSGRTISQNLYWQDPAVFYPRTIQYAPRSFRLYYNYGNWCFLSGPDPRAAIGWYKQAIAIEPQNPDGYHNLGQVYWALGEKGPARAALEQALALDPRRATTYLTLAEISRDDGDQAAAEKFYQQAVALGAGAEVTRQK